MILVEHADLVTEIDLREPGPSAGDMQGSGPNAVHVEADASAMGPPTQGTCIDFDAASGGITPEPFVFPDNSTLMFQRIARGGVPHGEATSAGPIGILAEPRDGDSPLRGSHPLTKMIEIAALQVGT